MGKLARRVTICALTLSGTVAARLSFVTSQASLELIKASPLQPRSNGSKGFSCSAFTSTLPLMSIFLLEAPHF